MRVKLKIGIIAVVSTVLFLTQSSLQVLGMTTSKRLHLRDAAKEMFNHGYNGYLKYAFPFDELKPLSCTGRGRDRIHHEYRPENDVLGDFCLTLVDTMDTLAIMRDKIGFADAVQKAIRYIPDFDLDSNVQVFETTIRMLGGLLSAHLIATDEEDMLGVNLTKLDNRIVDPDGEKWVYKGELLGLARELGWRLLPAFEASTNGFPYARVNLRYGHYLRETSDTCTAGAGTLLLEFGVLSRLTNETIFESVAEQAIKQIWFHRSKLGLVGNSINISESRWNDKFAGISAGIDSFYEYLHKASAYLGNKSMENIFNSAYQSLVYYLRDTVGGYVFLNVHMQTGDLMGWFIDSLSAFFPGLMVQLGDVSGAERSYMLYYHIWRRYRAMPERFNLLLKQVDISFYPLRPEFVESTYFLYTATKDPFYLEVGEMIMHDINSTMRTSCGFGSISDLHGRDPTKRDIGDRMESFALSETFKYLYLLFDQNNPINRSDKNAVFTTEAHYFPPLSSKERSPMQYPPSSSFATRQIIHEDRPPRGLAGRKMEFPRLKARVSIEDTVVYFNSTEVSLHRTRKYVKDMEVYPRITENKEYLEDQQLADTCQWPRCGDARMSRISVLDLFHYYRTGSAEGTRLTDAQVACLGSLDYVTSLPLRKDFDLVKLLVWPTAEVSGEKNSGVGKMEWVVEGGIVPFSERNRVELGMVFGLQCSAPGVHDIPKIATKPIPKEVIKSQLEQAMERTKSLANVWAEPNIVRFPVVPHLLMRSDGHLFTKYQQRLFGQLTRQGIRHQLDLNLTDFSKLSDSTLPISPEFMYSIKQNTSISFTNGALPLVTDLTYIRLCVEISNPASLSSLGVKIREDQRALHLNSGASLPKFDVCKEYIGRLARFSMRHTLYTSLKVVDDQTQIVIPHFLAGRTSLIFGCEHYTPREVSEIKDKIVMVVKGGGCSLYDKVVFAQEAGAKAILISDDSDVDLEPTTDSESGYVDPEVDSSVESSGSMAKLVSDKYRYGGLLSIDFPSLLESRSKKPVLNLGFQLNSEFNQDLYEEGEPKKDEKPLEKNISDMVHDEYESEENIDAFKAGFQSDDKKKDRHSESENLNVHKNPEGAPGNKFLYSPDKKAAVNNESVKEQSEKDTPAPPSKKPDSSSSSSHTSLSNRRLKNKIDHQQLIPSVYVYKEFFELVAKHISNRNIVKASIV